MPSKPQLNVIVTCTKDKRISPTKHRRLRSVPSGTVDVRFGSWVDRLKCPRSELVPAQNLYAGDHWSVVCGFANSRFKLNIWICSAGYGLIRMDDRIAPYAATFSRRHPDSVYAKLPEKAKTNAATQWWDLLADWRGPNSQSPRSLGQLASSCPQTPMLVIASHTYLNAIAGDLVVASQNLSNPDYLSIVSAGTKSMLGLTRHLIPCDARMQHSVGGARRSLNIRIGNKILSEAQQPPTLSSLKKRYRIILGKQPEMTQYNRKPLSDEEIRRYLGEQLQREPHAKHTPLLRKLRDQGFACEQSRFASLYCKVRGEMNGNS